MNCLSKSREPATRFWHPALVALLALVQGPSAVTEHRAAKVNASRPHLSTTACGASGNENTAESACGAIPKTDFGSEQPNCDSDKACVFHVTAYSAIIAAEGMKALPHIKNKRAQIENAKDIRTHPHVMRRMTAA